MRPTTTGRRLLAGLACLMAMSLAMPAAVADPDPGAPTQEQVQAAKKAAADRKRDVGAVQADLVLANQRLQDASIKAAQAAEAYNAARWQLSEARKAVKVADKEAEQAAADLTVHARAYNQVIAASYEMSPEMSTMAAIVDEDGIDGVVDQANTLYNVTSSMDDIQAAYQAAQQVADLATDEAEDARDTAAELEETASKAKATAASQEQAALAEAQLVAQQKEQLIAELAQLQDISVSLAAERQQALEQAALERAARAAQSESEAGSTPTGDEQPTPTGDAPSTPSDPDPQPDPTPDPEPTPDPTPDPAPAPDPEPTPDPQPQPDPPAPSPSAAQRAISFARAQIGEPYRWAAAGPGAWDCSGLTMKAWQKGGKSLPHYSVGQYSVSTPIRSSQLRPGDLVFWGNSSNPSSIYHVALYVGGGQMIHAPRTGRPVTEESMYYWIPPNFFARP